MEENRKPFYKSKLFAVYMGLISAIVVSSISFLILLNVVTSPNFNAGVDATEAKPETLKLKPTPSEPFEALLETPSPELPTVSDTPTNTPTPIILRRQIFESTPTPTMQPASHHTSVQCLDAVAICNDGSCSYERKPNKTCKGHGGIRMLY